MIRIYRQSAALKTALLVLGSASMTAVNADPPSGMWDVELRGEIRFTASSDGTAGALCETGTQIYRARGDDSFVTLRSADPDDTVARKSGEAMGRIISDFRDELHRTMEVEPNLDATRLFVFHFEFDNSRDPDDYEYELNYHSNEVLEADIGFGSFDGRGSTPQVAVYRDSAEQSGWLSDLPAGEALAGLNQAFGGIEGYVGTWLAADDDPVFGGTSIQILGMEALQSGGGDTGKSLFLVTGKFESDRLMSGNWRFVENSRLLDCISRAVGTGTWEARP